jgi:hypothetical protein
MDIKQRQKDTKRLNELREKTEAVAKKAEANKKELLKLKTVNEQFNKIFEV